MPNPELKRLAFFLPSTFTGLNMACGFASVLLSINHRFYAACLVIVLGAIFDSVDGRIARLTGTQSCFGEQFDSISDVVTFGVAPAILVYFRFLSELGRLGAVVGFLFLLCGALRLARFNANIDRVGSDYFQGLPIPAAAAGMVGITLLSLEFEAVVDQPYIVCGYILFYSVLMISNIPFNSFKGFQKDSKKKKWILILIFLLALLTFIFEHYMVMLIINMYVITSLIHFIRKGGSVHDVFHWNYENEENECS